MYTTSKYLEWYWPYMPLYEYIISQFRTFHNIYLPSYVCLIPSGWQWSMSRGDCLGFRDLLWPRIILQSCNTVIYILYTSNLTHFHFGHFVPSSNAVMLEHYVPFNSSSILKHQIWTISTSTCSFFIMSRSLRN